MENLTILLIWFAIGFISTLIAYYNWDREELRFDIQDNGITNVILGSIFLLIVCTVLGLGATIAWIIIFYQYKTKSK